MTHLLVRRASGSQSDQRPTIHVIARGLKALYPTLNVQLGRKAKVRLHEVWPAQDTLLATDIVVIDLTDTPSMLSGFRWTTAERWATTMNLYLVIGESAVASHWLHLAHRPGVKVFECGATNRDTGFSPLVTDILRRINGPTSEEVVELVLSAAPALTPLRSIILAVCADPWTVRRPADLARAMGTSLARIKTACSRLGYFRVEHLITQVRVLGLAGVIVTNRVPLAFAQRLLGIDDTSNLRKQYRRACLGSPHDLTMHV